MVKNMRFEKGHAPANKGGGKKIDAKAFEEYFMLYLNGQINQEKFAKGVGLSVPTLHKRLTMLFENGSIDGKFFKDGKPMIVGYSGFLRGDEVITKEAPKEEPKEPGKVIYPKL